MKTIITMLAAVILTLTVSAQQRSANSKKSEPANNAVTLSVGDVYRGSGFSYERFFNTHNDNVRVSARTGFGSGFHRNVETNTRQSIPGLLFGSGLLYGQKKWKLQSEALLLLLQPYPSTDFAISNGVCRMSGRNTMLCKLNWVYLPYEQDDYRHGMSFAIGIAF